MRGPSIKVASAVLAISPLFIALARPCSHTMHPHGHSALFHSRDRSEPDLLACFEARPIPAAVDSAGGRSHAIAPAERLSYPLRLDHDAGADGRVANCAAGGSQPFVQPRKQLAREHTRGCELIDRLLGEHQ